ncbi:hypothetical protein F5X96DRAFT_623721 [Biscogniauxia mediterranea]|nr:hypothetical protein F5X96DRAFT_623721 [Biscogniauxia mediterranea]
MGFLILSAMANLPYIPCFVIRLYYVLMYRYTPKYVKTYHHTYMYVTYIPIIVYCVPKLLMSSFRFSNFEIPLWIT